MRRITAFLLLFFVVLNVSAQSIEYAKEVVQKLSSPQFKGRGYVGNGNKIAADYIKEQYKRIGLKAFDNNYYQPFEQKVNTFPAAMNLQVDGVELTPGVDYLIDPSSPSLKGEYPVLYITKHDLLDAEKVKGVIASSSGKVLIIDETDFKVDDKEKNEQATDLLNFLNYSANVPAAAVIVHTSSKLMWYVATKQVSKPSFIVNKKLDFNTVKKVKINVKAKLIDYKTQNVIGYIEGTTSPDTFLVVTAHYDHLGKMGSDTYFPGANDNASGMAMLLNLAKYYAANRPRYSVAFMAFSAEEVGIVGANYYVSNPLFGLGKIKFLLNFDLAGTGDDGVMVVNGGVYEDEFDLLTRLNNEKGYLSSIRARGKACNSDHCAFDRIGVPCFYLYTMGGIQAYHDVYDKYETLPFTVFTDYYNLMVDFLNNLK